MNWSIHNLTKEVKQNMNSGENRGFKYFENKHVLLKMICLNSNNDKLLTYTMFL